MTKKVSNDQYNQNGQNDQNAISWVIFKDCACGFSMLGPIVFQFIRITRFAHDQGDLRLQWYFFRLVFVIWHFGCTVYFFHFAGDHIVPIQIIFIQNWSSNLCDGLKFSSDIGIQDTVQVVLFGLFAQFQGQFVIFFLQRK